MAILIDFYKSSLSPWHTRIMMALPYRYLKCQGAFTKSFFFLQIRLKIQGKTRDGEELLKR